MRLVNRAFYVGESDLIISTLSPSHTHPPSMHACPPINLPPRLFLPNPPPLLLRPLPNNPFPHLLPPPNPRNPTRNPHPRPLHRPQNPRGRMDRRLHPPPRARRILQGPLRPHAAPQPRRGPRPRIRRPRGPHLRRSPQLPRLPHHCEPHEAHPVLPALCLFLPALRGPRALPPRRGAEAHDRPGRAEQGGAARGRCAADRQGAGGLGAGRVVGDTYAAFGLICDPIHIDITLGPYQKRKSYYVLYLITDPRTYLATYPT